MVDSSSALWFGASGFEVLDVARSGTKLVIAVETTATLVGCWGCGTRARAKDRRWATLRDAPAGDVAVLVRWRKRIWACPDPDCEVRTWTELAELAEPRRVLTTRAERWAMNRIATMEGTPASIARDFRSVVVHGVGRRRRSRRGPCRGSGAGGADHDGWLRRDRDAARPSAPPAPVRDRGGRRRHRPDPGGVEGRDAKDLRAWMAAVPAAWLAQIQVVSVDPHEGYRNAVTNADPVTGLGSPLADVQVVVYPFHIVRVRHEAPCVRRRVRDPPLRAVAAAW